MAQLELSDSKKCLSSEQIVFHEEPVICKNTKLLIGLQRTQSRNAAANFALEEDATEPRVAFDGSDLD